MKDDGGNNYRMEDGMRKVSSNTITCPSCQDVTAEMNIMMKNDLPSYYVFVCCICHGCGYRTNDVKTTSISRQQQEWIVSVQTSHDWNRIVVLSDTCIIEIPELQLQTNTPRIGGMHTTIQGLLQTIQQQLQLQLQQQQDDHNTNLKVFLQRLQNIDQFTLILNDPLSESYIQEEQYDTTTTDNDCKNNTTTLQSTKEQNEMLGIHINNHHNDPQRLAKDPISQQKQSMLQFHKDDHPHWTAKGTNENDTTIMGG